MRSIDRRLLLVIFASLIIVAGSVGASTILLTDGFEDGNLNEYNDSTQDYTVTTEQSLSGDNSLKRPGGTDYSFISRDFDNSKIEKADFALYADSQQSVTRFTLSGTNGNVMALETDDNGNLTLNGPFGIDTGYTIPTDQWVHVSVQNINYSNNSYDVVITSTSGNVLFSGSGYPFEDSNPKANKFYFAGVDDQYYVDDVELTAAFDAASPDFQTGSASPSGGEKVTDTPVELRVNISDSDFAISQGDSVTVDFYDGNGTKLGSDTLSQNGTATANYSEPAGGANEWYAVATDSYGNTVTSQTFTFNAPSEVEIRDEETQALITNSDVTLEFYQQSNNPDNIEQIPVTNGTGDMTGLPADESFIAVADADGYADRRIYIDSLIETQTIYLLDDSTESANIEFEIDDFSGEYQEADTILVIERNINGNWTPVQGDFFGATGRFEATLKKDVRHRMRLVDIESGDERPIGTVTPQASGVRSITVEADGSVSVADEFEQIAAQPAVASLPAAEQADFAVDIQEGDTTITSYDIEVTVMNETAERQLATRSGSGTATEEFAFNLSADAGSTLVATVDYQTDDGESGSVTLSKQVRENYPGAEGLLGGLTTIGGVLSDDNGDASGTSMFAAVFLSLLVTASVARVSRSVESIGVSALGSVTGFAILGWIPMSTLFAATVAFGATIVLRRGI